MCFVWIWEQTAIISLYRIDWLVFITETECVYCAVYTEYLNTTEANLSIYSTKRPVFDPRLVRVRFVVYKLALGQILFSEYFRFTLSVSFRQFATLIFNMLL